MKELSGILLIREGDTGAVEVLLVRANSKWSIPKGKVNPGEHPRDAAVRELHEETCVELPVESANPIGYVFNANKDEPLHCFAAVEKGMIKPKPATEIKEARFFPLKEARKLIQPYQAPLLEAAEWLLIDELVA
jgi:8-oxo-dGTP diphosphatase